MILTFLMRHYTLLEEGSIKSTIVVSGYLLAILGNGLVLIWCLLLLLRGVHLVNFQPAWIFLLNAFFLIIQIYLLIR